MLEISTIKDSEPMDHGSKDSGFGYPCRLKSTYLKSAYCTKPQQGALRRIIFPPEFSYI